LPGMPITRVGGAATPQPSMPSAANSGRATPADSTWGSSHGTVPYSLYKTNSAPDYANPMGTTAYDHVVIPSYGLGRSSFNRYQMPAMPAGGAAGRKRAGSDKTLGNP
jgi:hypothetical protein